MRKRVSGSFWIEAVAATASGMLALLTLAVPEWIEAIFGADPDGGDGSLEWLVVVGLFAVGACCALRARYEWRQARPRTT